jgi:predicted secreted hydrolase
MDRRALVLGLAAAGLVGPAAAAPALPDYPAVRPGAPLRFPADHGAHPEYRTEWWYITGWLEAAGKPLGFQVTFFRTRPAVDQANPSAFAPRQVLFAHAAIGDPAVGRLLHDQRIARAGFGLAEARVGDAAVTIDDWSLKRGADGIYRARIPTRDFDLDLAFRPTQAVMAQGVGGYSRKGPEARQASHYFSLPHLAVSGTVRRKGKAERVTGTAWLDHEWSSEILAPGAVGWDWTGLNLDDGSALVAFQVRDAKGAAIWAGGGLRSPDGAVATFAPGEVRFEARRRWRSPRTGAIYPVETVVSVRGRRFPLTPLFDDQELDSRAGGGPVYWEGAVTTPGGRGFLELTGYAQPLRM